MGGCKDLCQQQETMCRCLLAPRVDGCVMMNAQRLICQSVSQTESKKRVGVKKMADKETSESVSENVFMIEAMS